MNNNLLDSENKIKEEKNKNQILQEIIEDKIDWTKVGQLHEATLQISKSCFEFKKLCVGFIGTSIAILVGLTNKRFDHTYFIIPLLICAGFWVADFTSYYYQKKTRERINKSLKSIAIRNKSSKDYVILEEKPKWRNASFNLSMSLYYVLAFFLIVGWISYSLDGIGN